MTPQELKNSILQMAIQGKLVEQRPEEGTAEELFAQIQEEKLRLIKEKKIRKEKGEYGEFKEEEILFDVPPTWKWVRFGSIMINRDSERIPLSVAERNKLEKTFDYYGASGIIDKVDRYLFDKTLLLIGEDGANLLARSTPIAFLAKGKYWVNNHVHVLDCVAGTLSLEYMMYFVNAISLAKYVTGTAQPKMNQEKMNSIPVPLPPFAEQKRIVAKIEELLPYIDRYKQAWSKLEKFNSRFPEDMKKSLLQYAIQGKLVEQRAEEGTGEGPYQQIQTYKQKLIKDGKLKKTRTLEPISETFVPFDFPPSWKVCYIDDIAFVTKLAGFEYTKYIADNLVADGIPLFKGKNVQNGKLVLSFESYIPESVSDELPRSQIAKKCLLTPYVGTIGNIAIFDGSFKAHLGSNVGKIEVLNSDTQTFVLEEYVLWYLKSTYGYAELTKHKKATAQESISIDAIRNVIIAIPPLEEQYRIVAKIEELLPLCERLK